MSTQLTATPAISEKKVSRREMLYYLLGGSVALLAVETCALAWFTQQQIPFGPKNGVFPVDLNLIPPIGAEPARIREAHAWLVNFDNGLVALSGYCPHDRVLFNWIRTNNRFECPNCGAKFLSNGSYISGPSPRSLDRFILQVKLSDALFGAVRTTPLDGAPVDIEGASSIIVDTRYSIRRPRR